MKALTTREVYQQLRDAAMGTRILKRIGAPTASGLQHVEIDSWLLTLEITEGSPTRCRACRCPQGREGSFESWLRTDPVSLLSGWEHAQIERLLGEAEASQMHSDYPAPQE
ncbi:hypothetical protein ALP10_03516 [Pseudomonas syringae pv. helianthi]|uniref:DUF7693 domain-containing protein n=4 Tax=Pseudomonas syringae group TaxID=136849 RepID=A0A0P9KG15_9PSED|nr:MULTISPECIES: hypothetical protein [Pseudomonas syringae group]KAA8694584.1 hypothetical protein F4W67_14565 [Pseudomonas caricapapayae]KPW54356.1 Uncharacterized protein ALO80_02737 [Pseudomonas caricapapayae]RMM08876.1 hypothetical protein ALQ84_04472 [Pseudomonas caricapapayae]RMV42416.1 hypothetical protein ALP10_03516 [Pseudomonas syringae pv. helianthi]RMV80183.1 hypothetical protein ALP05_03343 [Pseudomonas caricapapayae]